MVGVTSSETGEKLQLRDAQVWESRRRLDLIGYDGPLPASRRSGYMHLRIVRY
jgi:hypothetical protein